MSTIEHLPDNILLHIFNYTCVKERCIAGRVSRRWRRILRDKSLWRHVDLLPYRLDLQKMWKVIRSHLSDCLLSISVRGFVDKGGPKWNKHSLSPAMLQDLRERCPNIRELQMHYCNIDNMEASMLPESIEKLVFHGCYWPSHWLQNMSHKQLPHLIHVDVSCTKRIDTFDIQDICAFKDLKVLKANECYRIIPQSLQDVCQSLTHLEELEFGFTGIRNVEEMELSIHHMTRNLLRLKRLNLSGCPAVRCKSVCDILIALKQLEYLNVSSCPEVSADELMKSSTAFKALKMLVLDEGQLGGHTKQELEDVVKCAVNVCENRVKR